MFEIKNGISIDEIMTESEIIKLDMKVNSRFYMPIVNHVNLLNEPFPEFSISEKEDSIIRDIYNGKI